MKGFRNGGDEYKHFKCDKCSIELQKFIISNNYVMPRDGFDWFLETEAYYYSLSLPDGMCKNRNDFERILEYANTEILNSLNNTNYSDLHRAMWKK